LVDKKLKPSKRNILLLMVGLIALVIAGCSSGGDEEPTQAATAAPGSTAAPRASHFESI
jgi:PBP1b-binding outer membrane lipoprotein LpoB